MKGQGPADTTLLASLQQARATKQAVLEQGSVVSQLEGDFNTVLSPIMESCTKDDIAVSCYVTILHCLIVLYCLVHLKNVKAVYHVAFVN